MKKAILEIVKFNVTDIISTSSGGLGNDGDGSGGTTGGTSQGGSSVFPSNPTSIYG